VEEAAVEGAGSNMWDLEEEVVLVDAVKRCGKKWAFITNPWTETRGSEYPGRSKTEPNTPATPSASSSISMRGYICTARRVNKGGSIPKCLHVWWRG
jgi:hypothetical protein